VVRERERERKEVAADVRGLGCCGVRERERARKEVAADVRGLGCCGEMYGVDGGLSCWVL
jgi:hypothetical protein